MRRAEKPVPDISSPSGWVLSIAAAFLVGMAKTGFGGLGIFSVLLLAEVFPARESTGVLLPMMIFGDILGVSFYRRHASWSDLLRLIPPAAAGIVLGWWIMPRIPDAAFRDFLGWLIIVLMALTLLQRRFPGMAKDAAHYPAVGALAGVATGVTTMVANAAGAITAFYFLARRMDKMTFVGTTAWFYLVINLIKVPFSTHLGLINASSLTFDAMMVPAIVLGALSGRWLLHLVPQRLFEAVTIALAILAAVRLVGVS